MTQYFNPINKLILEFYFYLFFLNKYFQFFFYLQQFFYTNKINKINTMLVYFFNSNFPQVNYFLNNKKIFNKYNVLKLNFSFSNVSKILFNPDFTNQNIGHRLLKKNDVVKYKLFNLFFLFNYSMFNSQFRYFHEFNFFFISNQKNKIIVINSSKFLSR